MKKVENIRLLHNEAMKIAQRGILAEDAGNEELAISLYAEAFEKEKEVAMSLVDSTHEPTRSVMFRSAASLALNCHRYDDAKELIRLGLAGNTPLMIAEELISLHEEVVKKELNELVKQKKKELNDFMLVQKKELKESIRRVLSIKEDKRGERLGVS